METNLSGIVPHYKRRNALPTTYTPDEILRVEAFVDTNTDTGKRSLAIIRLSSRRFLQAGGIARLRLSEIDFGTGYVNVIQEKTGIPLSLQMPVEMTDTLSIHLEKDKHA